MCYPLKGVVSTLLSLALLATIINWSRSLLPLRVVVRLPGLVPPELRDCLSRRKILLSLHLEVNTSRVLSVLWGRRGKSDLILLLAIM